MTAAGLPLSPLLALDTAGAASTVAVMADGRLLAGDSRAMTTGHAEVLPGQVQAALAAAGLAPTDISLFGATVGPGSFTGVRIGLAALAGLALGAGRPMVGITRFALYAACLPDPASETRAWVCLDSRRGPVFVQAVNAVTGAWQPCGEPAALTPADAARLVAEDLVAGDAAARLGEGGAPVARLVSAEPTPADLARAIAAAAGRANPHCPAPLYLAAAAVTPPP